MKSVEFSPEIKLSRRLARSFAGTGLSALALLGCAKNADIAIPANTTTVTVATTEAPTTITAPVTTTTRPISYPSIPYTGPNSSPTSVNQQPKPTNPPVTSSSSSPNNVNINFDSFDGLILGLTVGDIGKHGYSFSSFCGGIDQITGPAGKLEVKIGNDGYAEQYSTTDNNSSTKSGIHVGSTEQDVRNTYTADAGFNLQTESTNGLNYLVLTSPASERVQNVGDSIYFLLNKSDLVSVISLQYNNRSEISAPPMC